MPTPKQSRDEQKRILIADDHAMFAETIGSFLRASLPKCQIATELSAESAFSECQRHHYELVLVDLDMGGGSGLNLIENLKSLPRCPPCMVVSMHNEAVWILRALKAGAKGFVAKDSPVQELLDGVRTMLTGNKFLSRTAAQTLAESAITTSNGKALHTTLTQREFEVLVQLAKGKPLKTIAYDLTLSAKTVAVHKYNIRKKTGLDSVVEIANYCREHGLHGSNPSDTSKVHAAPPAQVAPSSFTTQGYGQASLKRTAVRQAG